MENLMLEKIHYECIELCRSGLLRGDLCGKPTNIQQITNIPVVQYCYDGAATLLVWKVCTTEYCHADGYRYYFTQTQVRDGSHPGTLETACQYPTNQPLTTSLVRS